MASSPAGGIARRLRPTFWGWRGGGPQGLGRFWTCALFLLSLSLGCGADRSRLEIPAATLGSSDDAEEIFRPLMRRWSLGTKEERQQLDIRLEVFSQRFEGDDLVRLAAVLRAFNALDNDDLDFAMALVTGKQASRSPLFGPAGTTRDLANVVAGAVERRRGQPHRALSRLRPLLNKMLDDFATNFLDEELIRAAIGAHAWLDAVRFLEVWRVEAQPGSERYVEQQSRALLALIPKLDLLGALDERAAEKGPAMSPIARELAQQLAIIAVEDRDIALARQLVEKHKALLGSYGEAVARLAVDTTRGRVTARTVGVLLSLRTTAMKRRASDVTKGIAYALRARNENARLVSREATAESFDVIRAMSELAGEGAAVIIAGIDPAQSAAAAKYAADNALPIILLTPDPNDMGGLSSFIFFIGNDPTRSTGVLAGALRADGAKVVASYGAPLAVSDAGTGVGVVRSCDGATATDLEGEGVDAIIAADGAYCGAGLVERARKIGARLGVGLGASGLLPPPAGTLALAAGVFPNPQADARMTAWMKDRGVPPSWWTALARDAAVLAYSAVQDIEATNAQDETVVRARRQQAAVSLAQARQTLWTTNARGFVKSQNMARDITVVRRGAK